MFSKSQILNKAKELHNKECDCGSVSPDDLQPWIKKADKMLALSEIRIKPNGAVKR